MEKWLGLLAMGVVLALVVALLVSLFSPPLLRQFRLVRLGGGMLVFFGTFGLVGLLFGNPDVVGRGGSVVVIVVQILVYFYAGWRMSRYQGAGFPSVTHERGAYDERARELARERLPWFLDRVREHPEAAVRFPLETAPGHHEVVWGYVHSYADGTFNVSLLTEPTHHEIEHPSRFDVRADLVEDWQIQTPDGSHGGFTAIAMMLDYERHHSWLTPLQRWQMRQYVDLEGIRPLLTAPAADQPDAAPPA